VTAVRRIQKMLAGAFGRLDFRSSLRTACLSGVPVFDCDIAGTWVFFNVVLQIPLYKLASYFGFSYFPSFNKRCQKSGTQVRVISKYTCTLWIYSAL